VVNLDQREERKVLTILAVGIGAKTMTDEPRMPLTREGCADKAEDCRQDARHEANAQHRATLEHMATNWDRIALSICPNIETTK